MAFETWGTKFNWIMKHWELHRVLFHLYKEHSIKCFFIWTGGVGLLSSAPLFHRVCLLGFWPQPPPAFHCLFLLPVVSHNAHTPCLLPGWWKSPHCPWKCSLPRRDTMASVGDALAMLPEASGASISWATCLAAAKVLSAMKAAFNLAICE